MNINPDFKKHFDELEMGYLEIKEEVNSFPEKGRELEDRLMIKINKEEPWRINLMGMLGIISSNFDSNQKQIHMNYIQNSKYYKNGQEAPFYWRIINKPEGYAGDAEMMAIIYRNQFEGESNFGKFLHKNAVLSEACQAVRNRRDFLHEQIAKTGGGKILSVAAGPAMEMRDILDIDKSNNTYQFHAFDHDIKTIKKVSKECEDPRLKYVVGNAFHLIKGKYDVAVPRKTMIDYCEPRKDTKGLGLLLFPFKYSRDTLKREDYDLVYSAGFYDYVKTFPKDLSKGTIALTTNLFELVKSDGSLIIGNFSPNNPPDLRFPMEYVYDWQLIYRDEQELYTFANGIDSKQIKNIQILQEPTGINYFLKIDKK